MDTCTCAKYAPVSRQTHTRIALTVGADPCRTYGSCPQYVEAIAVLITACPLNKTSHEIKSSGWLYFLDSADESCSFPQSEIFTQAQLYLPTSQSAGWDSPWPGVRRFFFTVFWQEKHRNGLPARECL